MIFPLQSLHDFWEVVKIIIMMRRKIKERGNRDDLAIGSFFQSFVYAGINFPTN